MTALAELKTKATELHRLHEAPELLVLVNVWDVIGAKVVAAAPGVRALATASHSIAAAVSLPVSAELAVCRK